MDQFVYRRLGAREVVSLVRHGREVPNDPTVGAGGTPMQGSKIPGIDSVSEAGKAHLWT
jgi:hypothetical protein